MTPQAFLEHFETFAAAPNGIAKLREMILQLAVQGKLGTQDEDDEPATARSHDENSIEGEPTPSIEDLAHMWPFDVPKNWQWLRLRDTPVTLKYGTSVKCEYEGNGVPVLRIPNVVGGQVDLGDLKFGALTDKEQTDLRLEKGDLLLIRSNGSTGIVGRTAVVDENAVGFAYAGYLVRVRFLKQTWFPEFLHLAMISQTTREQIEGPIRTTSGVKNINSTEIGRLMLPLPPLAEQRRIVEKVDQLLGLCDELAARQAAQREKRQRLVGATLDRLVSTRKPAEFPTHAHRLRNHFDQLFDTATTIPQLRQTILQLAVQGQLVPQDPNDEPADVLLKKIATQKATLVNQRLLKPAKVLGEIVDVLPFEVPPSWIWAKLGEICLNVTDGFHNTPKTQPCGVPYLTAQHVKPDGLNFDNGLFVSLADHQELVTKTRPKRGDVLVVNIGAGCGTPAIIDVDFEFSFKNVAILNRPEGVETRYLFIHLLGKHAATLAELTKGGAQPFLSLGVLRETLIPLPPTAEQKRIVTKVTELLSLCDALEAKLTQAESASTQLLSAAVHHLLQM